MTGGRRLLGILRPVPGAAWEIRCVLRAKARRAGRIGGRPRLVVNRAKVAQMDFEGLTTREIGEELGISAASVSRILRTPRAAPGMSNANVFMPSFRVPRKQQ